MAQSVFLREQAERCRRLAHATSDAVTHDRLLTLAAEYDAQARAQDHTDEQPSLRAASREDDN
jgi:hypothetical protein